ncbi:uncharacterized protein MONOS_2705 [Monocercomonoides exilis]|uniref:uncharacterized protein n=1 Tax=Monocercomonoides exilis TaxID=2049356 RepID=UPI00355A08FC|nr:hypothetical protein MONOS_2705 [Monocercomonoides exilis]
MAATERLTELFSELKYCDEDEQKQKICAMNEIVDKMNREEYDSVFTTELFDKIHQMIEEKKLSMGKAILLLKCIGYWKVLKNMIVEEEQKKEGKNEKLLNDLCECLLSLNYEFTDIPEEITEICVSCLLKVALRKEENEETKKEAEMALLALSNIFCYETADELYLNEIREIIKYHQERCNLTRLAYQSAWKFLVQRFYSVLSLEEVIVNELYFAREAIKELNELINEVD